MTTGYNSKWPRIVLLSTTKDNLAKNPKQLVEYSDTRRDVVFPILYFDHFFSPPGENFLQTRFSVTCLIPWVKMIIFCGVRWVRPLWPL